MNNQLKTTNWVLEEYKNKTQENNIVSINHVKEVKKIQQKALTNFNTTLEPKKEVIIF